MTRTQLVAAKRAVIGLLQDKQPAQPALMAAPNGDPPRPNDVLIHYAYNLKLAEMEYVWGGATRMVRTRVGLAGFNETITLELFVDVRMPAGSVEAADTRGSEIAEAVDAILSADPKLNNVVPGLVYQQLVSGETSYSYDDDAVVSSLVLELLLSADLRGVGGGSW